MSIHDMSIVVGKRGKIVYRKDRHGCHTEIVDEHGERIFIEPTEKDVRYIEDKLGLDISPSGNPEDAGYRSDHRNSSMGGELNRGFDWRDPEKGLDKPIISYPDRLIPHLRCPDCSSPACETDQVGVALCTSTPGWYFYYRQQTDGFGDPKIQYKLVNGEMQEVTEYDMVKIERQPDGDFKEVKEKD